MQNQTIRNLATPLLRPSPGATLRGHSEEGARDDAVVAAVMALCAAAGTVVTVLALWKLLELVGIL